MANDEQILSVKQLTRYIKDRLEGDLNLQNIWIRGEISNFTHHSRGHMYFTLKDADSRVRAVMFASHNRKLPFMPRDGSKVMARGNISVYDRDGQYQFYVTEMQPDGIGNLYLAFEKLKKQLEQEGLFSEQNKKRIPSLPRTIGVITSPTGAAVRDIITTLKRRFPTVSILLYPVLVQGEHAAKSIVKAIEIMNQRREVDVLIVGRGGGSLEELWAFNEEIVARSIFRSELPIISAVGHETDFTISDFVADVRAATPTAAAELAVPHVLELKQQVQFQRQRLQKSLLDLLKIKQEQFQRLKTRPVFTDPSRQLRQPSERLDRLTEQLVYRMKNQGARYKERLLRLKHQLSLYDPSEQIEFSKQKLESMHRQLIRTVHVSLQQKKQDYVSSVRQLDALSPLKVMQRGYSVVYDEKEKHVLTSLNQVQIGDVVKIKLTDGRIDCHVWSMKENEDG